MAVNKNYPAYVEKTTNFKRNTCLVLIVLALSVLILGSAGTGAFFVSEIS